MFVSLESPSALGLCANEISVRHTLRVLQEMLCQYWDFGEGFGATSNTLTYQWRGAAEVGTNTQHTSCSAGMVCVPAPVPGRTQGNLPLLWQKITLCTGCKGKMSVHTSSSSKAVNHCQFTPWLWTFIPHITQSWCTAVQAAQAQHRWLLPELQLQKLSERECKLWRVLLILDKPKQLMDTVCILIHLRLGLLLAYFAFWFFCVAVKWFCIRDSNAAEGYINVWEIKNSTLSSLKVKLWRMLWRHSVHFMLSKNILRAFVRQTTALICMRNPWLADLGNRLSKIKAFKNQEAFGTKIFFWPGSNT